MSTTILIIIAVFIIVIIFGLFRIILNLLSQIKQYESYINTQHFVISDKIKSSLQKMKDADIRGSFESDDEVGAAFKDIKDIIEQLDKEISEEYKEEF